jgi:hypothetical protein
VSELGSLPKFEGRKAKAEGTVGYLVLGLVFIGLELWRMVGPHQHGAIMPLWGRIIFPLLIVAGVVKVKGREMSDDGFKGDQVTCKRSAEGWTLLDVRAMVIVW